MENIPINLLNPKNINDEDKQWSGPFTFVQAADTQLGLLDIILNVEQPNWDKEKALCRESIKRINEMKPKPKFYVICGDMLDAFPFEGNNRNIFDHWDYNCVYSWDYSLGSSRTTRAKQYADFVDIFRSVDPEIKLVCVCGNHDIGDIPTSETVQLYRTQFGQDYFKFCYGGVLFVVLNSQYWKCPDAIPEETSKQSEFIDQLANDTNPKPKHIGKENHLSASNTCDAYNLDLP